MTPRPGRVSSEIAIDAPYPRDERFRTSAEYAGYCRHGLRSACARRMAGRREQRHERALRLASHRRAGWRAGASACWCGTSSSASTASRPTSCRRRAWCCTTLVSDWPILWTRCWRRWTPRSKAFVLAVVGGIGLAVLFNQSRLIEHSLYPYRGDPAGDAGGGDRAAAADLSAAAARGAGLRLDRRVLSGARQHHARAELGRPQSADLFGLYTASRWQVLWNLKLPAALPQMLAGLRIAGGLSLIGAVVAEIAAGSAGAGSGLAYRIAESGYRLNIPRMFAALLLLSPPASRSSSRCHGCRISRCAAGTKARSGARPRHRAPAAPRCRAPP